MPNHSIQTTEVLPAKVFNTKKTDYLKPSIIFGEDLGLFDTINKHYPDLWQLYKTLKSQDWDENEFDYSSCNQQFKQCDRHTYDMMIKTLAWQWEADSVAARSIAGIMAPVCTNPEAWAAWVEITRNECLTPDHEVLTPKGWRTIDTITSDDEVAQWNYKTKGISFTHPTKIIINEHNGKMFNFHDNNGNLSQITTPKHRMPIVYPYWENGKYENKLAEDAHYHGGNGLPTSGIINSGSGMTVQEKLYIAVQADGTLCSDAYTGERTGKKHYKFTFSKERKIQRLFNLCHEANWEIREINVSRNDGRRTFYVYLPLEEYNPRAKSFDWIDLSTISLEWANDFIEELSHWDGNITKKNRVRYISTNKQCIDIAQAIGHLAGKRAHITTIPERFNAVMPGGTISNTKEAYQLYFSDSPYITGNSIVKEEIEYNGLVYCLSVPDTYFLVRRNGSVSVTGNCVHAATYSEIVRGSFDDPNVILGEILQVEEAMSRLKTVTMVIDKAHATAHKYALGQIENDQEAFNDIFMFIIAIFFLERVQFMASFGVTFAIVDTTGLFQPIGKAVQKIAQDEFEIHVQMGRKVLTHLVSTDRGKIAMEQCQDQIVALLDEVVKSEETWTRDFAFADGRELTGVTCNMMIDWVYFNGSACATFLDIKDKVYFPIIEENPLKYMEKWINISTIQSSPQEEHNNQYKLGVMQRDDENVVFDMDSL